MARPATPLLVEHGLIEARPNPAHRRSPIYALTARGRASYEQADALWTEYASALAVLIPAAAAHAATATVESMLRAVQALTTSLENES